MNWWLVANHLKHGMMTVREAGAANRMPAMDMSHGSDHKRKVHPPLPVMTIVSVIVLVAGLTISWMFGGLS